MDTMKTIRMYYGSNHMVQIGRHQRQADVMYDALVRSQTVASSYRQKQSHFVVPVEHSNGMSIELSIAHFKE